MKLHLARLTINRSRLALSWLANAYRVHQRLMMAYDGEPRLLFRVEPGEDRTFILAQSQQRPNFERAFGQFGVLACAPEAKFFELGFRPEQIYRFRLLANPVVTRVGSRYGLFSEEDQRAWLQRKLAAAGAELLGCRVEARGLQRCSRGPAHAEDIQTHLAVCFEGNLRAIDPAALSTALASGIGPAKGFGFGLLSLAPLRA